jgi:hypothetical protein
MSLERFVQAQEKTYAGALAELKAGKKTGHWIWWIFPQLRGLGTSHNSTYYGLADEAEAQAYFGLHPEIVKLLLDFTDRIKESEVHDGLLHLRTPAELDDLIRRADNVQGFHCVIFGAGCSPVSRMMGRCSC